jgi:hypothetical protein
MSDRDHETSAKDGWITLAFSLALWLLLLALFLGVGHLLAASMAEGH